MTATSGAFSLFSLDERSPAIAFGMAQNLHVNDLVD
jgi:hypothetical protein